MGRWMDRVRGEPERPGESAGLLPSAAPPPSRPQLFRPQLPPTPTTYDLRLNPGRPTALLPTVVQGHGRRPERIVQ